MKIYLVTSNQIKGSVDSGEVYNVKTKVDNGYYIVDFFDNNGTYMQTEMLHDMQRQGYVTAQFAISISGYKAGFKPLCDFKVIDKNGTHHPYFANYKFVNKVKDKPIICSTKDDGVILLPITQAEHDQIKDGSKTYIFTDNEQLVKAIGET